MNERQVHKFVQRYLEATNCHVMEKSPAHYLVKLSPKADRELMNRTYYWGFIDRTGAEPETMSLLLVTDKQKYDEAAAQEKIRTEKAAAPSEADQAAEAALSRTRGFLHGTLNTAARVPREDLHYGSHKLKQLFDSARHNGSYVCLFQEPEKRSAHPLQSTAYTAWLGVNLKVEFACDMKREEIHSFGVSLATGQCVERFYDRITQHRMTPKLPPNIHTAKNALTLNKAATIAEQTLERKLKTYDYAWAAAAAARLDEELVTLHHYYEPLLASIDEEQRTLITEQFQRRQDEIRWQYEPRVSVSAINCGIFYLEGIG
ncbi:YqhG family protein [Paenibacillus sepulcri]